MQSEGAIIAPRTLKSAVNPKVHVARGSTEGSAPGADEPAKGGAHQNQDAQMAIPRAKPVHEERGRKRASAPTNPSEGKFLQMPEDRGTKRASEDPNNDESGTFLCVDDPQEEIAAPPT